MDSPICWDLADDLYELEDELREDPELWESINEILDNIHKLQKNLRELYIRTCVRQLYHGEWYFYLEDYIGWENFYRLIPKESLFIDCGYQSDEISYNKAFERALQIFEDSQNPDLYVDEKRGLILMALLARNGYEKAYPYAPIKWDEPILIE